MAADFVTDLRDRSSAWRQGTGHRMEGERDSLTTGKGLKSLADFWYPVSWVFPGTFTLGHLPLPGGPSQRQLGLAKPRSARNARSRCHPAHPSRLRQRCSPVVWSVQSELSLPSKSKTLPSPARRGRRLSRGSYPSSDPWPPREEPQRGGRPHVTFHGHGFQDAELLEDGNKQQHHHGHGAQLHTLDAHGERSWDRGAPLRRALPGGAGARASRPASGAAAHMPRAGGATGVGGAGTPWKRRRQ